MTERDLLAGCRTLASTAPVRSRGSRPKHVPKGPPGGASARAEASDGCVHSRKKRRVAACRKDDWLARTSRAAQESDSSPPEAACWI
jgi:hypothetical protein